VRGFPRPRLLEQVDVSRVREAGDAVFTAHAHAALEGHLLREEYDAAGRDQALLPRPRARVVHVLVSTRTVGGIEVAPRYEA
jgi:hypothetical protein